MRLQLNTVAHNPPHSYGDCFRTCVAVMLDLPAEQVPHVFSRGEDGPTAHAAMDAWLAGRGLELMWVIYPGDTTTLEQVMRSFEVNNPGLPVMIGGLSRPGCGHFIVAQHGEVACDPAPGRDNEAALIGPHDDGMWVVGILVARLNREVVR